MLGQSLIHELKRQQFDVVGAALDSSSHALDISIDEELISLINTCTPHVIINTVAIVNLSFCEKNKKQAYLVNSRPASIIAQEARKISAYVIHISSDHYYVGDADKKHSETDPVQLINEYSKTKYAAECFALTYENSLVMRTNIVGFRNQKEKPTFIEWIIDALINNKTITVFEDYFTSSINVTHFAKILIALLQKKCIGIWNVASCEVFSKKDFIFLLAHYLGYSLPPYFIDSVKKYSDGCVRAESLGLDVAKIEAFLGCKMPSMKDVVISLVQEYYAALNTYKQKELSI